MDEKVKVPEDDQMPYLRIYGASGQPVRLWQYNRMVQDLFTPGYKRDLPLLWEQGFKNDPGEG